VNEAFSVAFADTLPPNLKNTGFQRFGFTIKKAKEANDENLSSQNLTTLGSHYRGSLPERGGRGIEGPNGHNFGNSCPFSRTRWQ
jgi:hypothetical protein